MRPSRSRRAIIKKDPFTELDAADASPRLEAMFTGVETAAALADPGTLSHGARAGLDKKDYSAAEPPLTQAHLMIADAEKLGVRDDASPISACWSTGSLQMIRLTSEQRKPAVVAAASEVAAHARHASSCRRAPPQPIQPPTRELRRRSRSNSACPRMNP